MTALLLLVLASSPPDAGVSLSALEVVKTARPLEGAPGRGPAALVVLDGTVTLRSCTGPVTLRAGEAALVEGQFRERLEVDAKAKARVLVAATRDGELAARPCHRGDGGSALPFVLPRVSPEVWPLPGNLGAVTLLAGQHLADQLSVAKLFLAADAGVPRHLHPVSLEALHAVSGDGALEVADAGSSVKAGETVLIPAATWHEFRAGRAFTGWQFYWPAGPEQRFRKVDAGTPTGPR
ncbi:MAG: cupin domain-containing protein [Myxococcaceae bacterium]|nr:cupin domain-containing protein [Myxococcaceae bacterium]